MPTSIHPRICPFCEASCGLLVEADVVAAHVKRITGDPDHPGSRGYLCPKSQGLAALRQDPDRLLRPLLRDGGRFREIGWDEALDRAAAGIRSVIAKHGERALGIYTGNPSAHDAGMQLALGALAGAVPALHVNSGSIDCYPRMLVDAYLYGNIAHVPVPDVDRTHFFLIFGGNPMVSNGSMMGAPDMPQRLRRLRARGGWLAVVDPCRTATAAVADEHLAIRPGSDGLLALAMIDTLFSERLVRLGHLADFVEGCAALRVIAARFPAERVAPMVRIEAERIRQLARRFAAARTAAAYGRVGANCQAFGSLAIWLIDCLNILTGNLDVEGGAMFPTGALPPFLDMPWRDGAPPHGRWHSRVSGTAELGGSMPTQVLWEEIDTAGEGQVRGLVMIAGNPAVSNAHAGRVTDALAQLEFMIAVDIYLNETTRHADLILPPMDHLKRVAFTTLYGNWAVDGTAAFSAPVFPRASDDHDDWDILVGLAARLAGRPVEPFAKAYAESYLAAFAPRLERLPSGLSSAEALARAGGEGLAERMFDVLLRGGPVGDGFGAFPDGATLERLKQSRSGQSFGPMRAGRFPAAIDRPEGRIALVPPILEDDVARLERAITAGQFADGGFLLINRRSMRSNNSWMHNLRPLAKGRNRCTALINPGDAQALGIVEGERVRLRSRVGAIEIEAEISDRMSPGVISVPHGWGAADPLVRLTLAQGPAYANVNLLSDDSAADGPSGGACFNATPIAVERVAPAVGDERLVLAK